MPPRIVVYLTSYCSYCFRAKRLLERKSLSYEKVDVTGDEAARRWLREVTGRRTVPQIFIGGDSIGGYDELAELESSGKLDEILARQSEPSP